MDDEQADLFQIVMKYLLGVPKIKTRKKTMSIFKLKIYFLLVKESVTQTV